MVELDIKQWNAIRGKLAKENSPSVMMIRSAMKRELGFTVREHKDYDYVSGHYLNVIHLDFYDDAKETWFRLRYLNND